MQEITPTETTTPPVIDKPNTHHKTRSRQVIFVGGLVVFALLIRFNLRQGEIWGNSMEPTYRHATTVLVWKTVPRASLKPGDVIIFKDVKGEELIKRIALIRPWQSQSPSGSYVHPNGGRLIPYSLLFDAYFANVRSGGNPLPSPENTIYVLRDNLIDSEDSRVFGPIGFNQVLGKVIP